MNEKDLEAIRGRFSGDRFATESGAVIEDCADGYARCSLALKPCHRNAAGGVMGGAIFTLADFAFAVASNWNRPLHVTRTSQITFLGAAKGSRLVAEAKMVKEGRSTCYYLVEIRDETGGLIAEVTVDGFIVGPKE